MAAVAPVALLLGLTWWKAAGVRRRAIGFLMGLFLAYTVVVVTAPAFSRPSAPGN